jgi:hypothetical protein
MSPHAINKLRIPTGEKIIEIDSDDEVELDNDNVLPDEILASIVDLKTIEIY